MSLKPGIAAVYLRLYVAWVFVLGYEYVRCFEIKRESWLCKKMVRLNQSNPVSS